VEISLDHGDRRFRILAHHDAIRHDGPALELAELVDGEVGPELVTVLFDADNPVARDASVLLTNCDLPLPILTGFMEEAAREQRRLGEHVSPTEGQL
jgi:hypothetical protein